MKLITIKHLRYLNVLLVSLSMGLIAACTSSGRTNIDTHSTEASVNFTEQKTYRWDFSAMSKLQPEGGHMAEFDRVLCDHVDKLMAEKGYTRITKGTADFTLDYRIVISQQEAVENTGVAQDANAQANDYGLRWTFDKDESPSFKGLQAPKNQTTVYQHGTLHLAAFDSQNRSIWHSSASRIVNGHANEAERRAALRIAVDKIMKTFPAK